MIKKNYYRHKETINNFTWRVLQVFGKQGITFLIFILCAKLLSPYEFGLYNYALALVLFLVLFCDFGISTSTSKHVAEYNIADKEKLKGVLFNSAVLIFILTILLSILILLLGPIYLKEKYVYLIYVLPLLLLAPLTSLYDGIYRGLKQFKKLALTSIFAGLISLTFVYTLIKKYGIIGALISQNLFYLILFIFLAAGYKNFTFKIDKAFMKKTLSYSVFIGFSSLGYFMYTRPDVILLGAFNYITEISYFELVNKIFILIGSFFAILGQVIAPNISKHFVLGERKIIREKYVKFVMFSLFCGIVISIILYLLIPIMVKYFLPQYFNPAFLKIFKILIFIFPLNIVSQSITQSFIVATGNAKYSIMTIPFGIINIILAYFFLIKFGYIGVLYATIITSTINRVITWSLIYREFTK